MENKDLVNNPDHYHKERVTITFEPIDLCEECGFLLGNALKYLFRYKNKGNPKIDLEKSKWLINRYLDKYSLTKEHHCKDKYASRVDIRFIENDIVYQTFEQTKPFLQGTREYVNNGDVRGFCKYLLNFIEDELKGFKKLPEPIEPPKPEPIISFPTDLFRELTLFLRNNTNDSWYATNFDTGVNLNTNTEQYYLEGELKTKTEVKQTTLRFRIYYKHNSSCKEFYLLNTNDKKSVYMVIFNNFNDEKFITWFKASVEKCK